MEVALSPRSQNVRNASPRFPIVLTTAKLSTSNENNVPPALTPKAVWAELESTNARDATAARFDEAEDQLSGN